MRRMLLLTLILQSAFLPLSCQTVTPPKFEMRGAWVSTVVNLDWPTRGASPATQQQELRQLFDDLKRNGINTIFFQVRSESDAMYPSSLEPWSYYLTGTQGLAPVPAWDPLAFAIEEAHIRGMELHAWINPFRVIRAINATYPKAFNHLSVQKPEWMLTVKTVVLLNPGIPEARKYLIDLLSDLVKKYELDGLHYDDYFYPYEGITSEDAATYAVYGAGLSLNAWREDNINRFVRELGAAALEVKPWLKYGVSPFGIWRSGVPAGITGLSGADVTYGNAVKWLEGKWIDYLVPQLYWKFGGGQDFAKLSLWWKSQMNGRHLYPGLAAYKAEPSMTAAASLYTPGELPAQVRFTRDNNIPGVVWFRAANLSKTATQGLADSLRFDLYAKPALTPVMDWKDKNAPAAPVAVDLAFETNGRRLTWEQPAPQGDQASPRFFAVYRVQSGTMPDWAAAAKDPKNLLAISSKREYFDAVPVGGSVYWYAVSTISRNSVESPLVAPAQNPVAAKELKQLPFGIAKIYPNPFELEVRIQYQLKAAGMVTLRIVNLQGQEVARLLDGESRAAGEYEATWQSPAGRGRQAYVCVLEVDGKRVVKKMVRM